MPSGKKRKQRAEFVDFDVGVDTNDPGIINRDGVTVCPFGEGVVCAQPGCMACDDGVRCCSPGDTCVLDGEDNWCVGFRGTGGGSGGGGGVMGGPRFPKEPLSFWAMK
jgi:hypothetical protein